jgi:hypothetical protein
MFKPEHNLYRGELFRIDGAEPARCIVINHISAGKLNLYVALLQYLRRNFILCRISCRLRYFSSSLWSRIMLRPRKGVQWMVGMMVLEASYCLHTPLASVNQPKALLASDFHHLIIIVNILVYRITRHRAMFLTFMWEVLNSNLGQDTGCPDWGIRDFPQSQANVGIVPRLRHDHLHCLHPVVYHGLWYSDRQRNKYYTINQSSCLHWFYLIIATCFGPYLYHP